MSNFGGRPASWLQIASRPKWVGALAIALAVAAICAGLAQWQLARSIADATAQAQRQSELKNQTAVPLETLAQPNEHLPANNTSKLVSFRARVDKATAYVVDGRLQLTKAGVAEPGYWLIAKAVTDKNASIAVVIGWTQDRMEAYGAMSDLQYEAEEMDPDHMRDYSGYLEYPEPPQNTDPGNPWLLKSVASSQLANLWSPDQPIDLIEGFVILKDAPAAIRPGWVTPVTYKPGDEKPLEANWLNIFYGIEWSVFAGFAFFMWWRLVEDERKKELADWLAQPAGSASGPKPGKVEK